MRSTKRITLFLLVALTAGPLAAAGQETGTDDIGEIHRQAYQFYESGRIEEAEHLALKTLDTRRDISRFDRAKLHIILAFCAVANDDSGNAKRQFVEALRLDPTITPDLIIWPPKIRRVFADARVEADRIAEQERRYHWATTAGLCRDASLRSLYLPGSGQVRKGERLKGTVVGALFWSAAASFVYSQLRLPQARRDYLDASNPDMARDRWVAYRDYYRLATISGTLAAAVYIYAFADALWWAPLEPEENTLPTN